jgi:2-keto-4-pentenoate hydratase/2-oxohepta-3-ene-1,7-dioic acid hydratase in catechol pathway
MKPEQFGDVYQTEFALTVNGEPRQLGFTNDMITPVYELIAYISQIFTLEAGDIVLTGTPEGVAALVTGDQLVLSVVGQRFETIVV